MTDVDTFLGEIVAKVIRALIDHAHPGVRLQHVTAFNPETMLKNLNVEPKPRIAIAGGSITELVRKTKYPTALLTSDLAEATEWRNDPKVGGTVVIVSFGEEERLGSFHRFTEIRDHDLYREICETAFKEICPNDVQINWWRVLAKAEIRRQISVYRLASYFLHLKAKPKQIPDAARDGLYLLGLELGGSFRASHRPLSEQGTSLPQNSGEAPIPNSGRHRAHHRSRRPGRKGTEGALGRVISRHLGDRRAASAREDARQPSVDSSDGVHRGPHGHEA